MTQQSMTQAPSTPPPTGARRRSRLQRQFVNFAFYRLDPAFRRLDDNAKFQARSEFLKLFEQTADARGLMCLTYSTVGLQERFGFPALADRVFIR